MMMQMLQAGGWPLLTDGQRAADDSNPRGYLEYVPVRATARDHAWLPMARGKAVKVVIPLLAALPDGYRYRVIALQRPAADILRSQRDMLADRGHSAASDEELLAAWERQAAETHRWLSTQAGNCAVLPLDYDAVLSAPRDSARAVNQFLGGGLDIEAMCAAVAPRLRHHHRTATTGSDESAAAGNDGRKSLP